MLALGSTIDRECALVSEFISALQTEQVALKEGRVADLAALASQKAELVQQLNQLETTRLSALGSVDKNSMVQWLAANPDEVVITGKWKKLLNLAKEAKSLHETNAQLIAMHLKQTNELLAVLTQPTGRVDLYGASGQTIANSGSRIIDSA